MPKPAALTKQQEGFARSVAKGMNQSDAYRANYDVTGLKETTTEAASRLMRNSKVAAMVAELKGRMEKKLEAKELWTREQAVNALKYALILAKNNGKPTEMVTAARELNVMHGYNAPSKIELTRVIDPSLLSDDQLAAIALGRNDPE